ncbi:uncharacterized protein LOC134177035 [Corticium candelabrum]|uniref:uncharacterized protein LOC134177035 n=1 Tax=Corticium candelabrum TaxID=121492 RepID=UPI002E270653|nr:uncharacterized protein LOC134177035 [Corticium candelabrum]
MATIGNYVDKLEKLIMDNMDNEVNAFELQQQALAECADKHQSEFLEMETQLNCLKERMLLSKKAIEADISQMQRKVNADLHTAVHQKETLPQSIIELQTVIRTCEDHVSDKQMNSLLSSGSENRHEKSFVKPSLRAVFPLAAP